MPAEGAGRQSGPVAGEAASLAAARPGWAVPPGWAVRMTPGWLAGTIVPGRSMAANRDHAPYQPSVVSGQRSNGCDPGTSVGQIP